jgi:hypothetical protein
MCIGISDEVVVRIETLVEASISLSKPITELLASHVEVTTRQMRARTASTASAESIDETLAPTTGVVMLTCYALVLL